MSQIDQVVTPPTTDSSMDQSKKQKSTGRGSKQRRTDAYRAKKNEEADAAILSGIFSRLKIKDPTTVASAPMVKETHTVIAPVVFDKVPAYVDRIWDTMQSIGARPFTALDTPANKNIFKKGVLLLCEAKVCVAQRQCSAKPDEALTSRKLYSLEQLNDLAAMCAQLPYPIAILLECLGVVADNRQTIVPVLSELTATPNCSGARTYAPNQLLPLLTLLRAGVPQDQEVHNIAQALNVAPGIEWEQFVVPAAPDAPHVRLTLASYNFWTVTVNDVPMIKWDDTDRRMFERIVKSLTTRRGFIIMYDLLHGDGALAQVVQTTTWTIDESTYWFTMCDVPEYDIKLGVALGLAPDSAERVQPSRFRGSRELSYWRGEMTPRRIIDSILAGLE